MTNPILRVLTDGPAPLYATQGAAGLDLRAGHDAIVPAGSWRIISTGVAIALPPGHAGLICPRSGLAAAHGVTVLNAPGVVDEDYRGTVKVILMNCGETEYHVAIGDRIAQLLVVPCAQCDVEVVLSLDDTERGTGGFGSSGSK